jgi:predicted patatin/cPLA2 family phospholipase
VADTPAATASSQPVDIPAATASAAPVDTPVLQVIRARAGGRRDDRYKLGLAVEGGGMRGIVSGGMLLALRDLGMVDAFDAYYGTSSGSLNLAYLFGGSDWDALSIYYDHLTAGFVRRQRWNVARPLLDMQYAFDEVIARLIPIGWERIRRADRPINAVLTNVERLRPETKDMRTNDGDGVEYLKATSRLPELAGPPPVVSGTRYLDGGVLCPDPVYAALADGCTHVLLLNTSPQGLRIGAPRARAMLRPVLNRWRPGLGEAYLESRIRWDADRSAARYDCDVSMDDCAVLRVAPPPGSHQVERLTMRRDLLLDGARVGYQAITDLVGADARPYFSLSLR